MKYLIFLLLCVPACMIGCSDPSQEYVREHGPCAVEREVVIDHSYFTGSEIKTDPSFTTFNCNGVHVFVNYVNGRPWRP